jgi:hypothetical protein
MPLEPESDLHWTAFLYLGGDLPPDEATRFEARLADDQGARDALAGAVELAEALAIVGPEFRPRRRAFGRRALVGALATAAAACVALAISPWSRPVVEDRPDASAVAIAWSSLRSGLDAEPAPVASIEDEGEIEPSTDRPLPSWLLSAASVPVGDEPREEE